MRLQAWFSCDARRVNEMDNFPLWPLFPLVSSLHNISQLNCFCVRPIRPRFNTADCSGARRVVHQWACSIPLLGRPRRHPSRVVNKWRPLTHIKCCPPLLFREQSFQQKETYPLSIMHSCMLHRADQPRRPKLEAGEGKRNLLLLTSKVHQLQRGRRARVT